MDITPDKKKTLPQINVAMEPIWMAGQISYYRIYLINDTMNRLSFNFRFSIHNKLAFSHKNELAQTSAFFLNTIEFMDLNNNPVLEFDLEFEQESEKHHVQKILRIKPKDLSKKLVHIPLIPSYGYIYKIHQIVEIEKLPEVEIHEIDLENLKEQMMKPRDEYPLSKDPLQKTYVIVDLHIENLVNDYQVMNNTEIIHIQLSHFRKMLDNALSENLAKMHVIHGIGKGKLKNEIFGILKDHPGIKSYANSYDVRFGFGATEIIFK